MSPSLVRVAALPKRICVGGRCGRLRSEEGGTGGALEPETQRLTDRLPRIAAPVISPWHRNYLDPQLSAHNGTYASPADGVTESAECRLWGDVRADRRHLPVRRKLLFQLISKAMEERAVCDGPWVDVADEAVDSATRNSGL